MYRTFVYLHAVDRKTKTTDMMGTVELGKHWLELSNLRAKVKRKVDTKASKGSHNLPA